MKKFKLLALGLCLIASITACGKESEKTYTAKELAQMSDDELEELFEKQLENFEEDMQEDKEDDDNAQQKGALSDKLHEFLNNDSSDNSSTTITDSDTPTASTITDSKSASKDTAKIKQKVIDAEWHSGIVQIDDIVFQLPITTNELLDLGFTYQTDFFDNSISEDYLFTKGENITIYFTLNNQFAVSLSFINTLDGFHTISDIIAEQNPVLNSISSTLQAAGMANTLPITYAGGLKVGDSFQLIEEHLGAPASIKTDSHNMMYYYGNPGANDCGMIIYVSRDTQAITNFTLERFAAPNAVKDNEN
ncbi:MAG: hypothetical protein IJC02_09970 [Lachnospiraceae bacterium]|nr:hypothetical protein [Lachnospiraceae bacterium]